MTDVNDWPGHPDADPDCECCLGDGLQADGETLCPCIDARKANIAAQTITPAPQPAGEAVPVAWQRRKPGRADWQDIQPEYANEQRRLGYEVRPLYAHPPQPSEAVTEAGRCAGC